MQNLETKVKRLQWMLYSLLIVNAFIILTAFRDKFHNNEKFDEIDVGRINVVDKNGVIKLVIASNNKIRQDSQNDNVNKDEFKASGILFRNEEGEECGSLIYSGKKTKNGQNADASLTFDQYNQDQNLVLMHKEAVDSLESSIDDGLMIIQRPDYKKVAEEYKTYEKLDNLSLPKEKIDSIKIDYGNKDIISRRRLFIGTKRGVKDNKAFNETGLFIKSNGGANKIGIFVDKENIPHLEVYGADGKTVVGSIKFAKDK
jgi:hypothetical protein